MEACIRGFSFMPETKFEAGDLKYVESEDLERTWKTIRRERLKQQEQKIWEEFVKEQDIVHNICQDDPYQFLDQLPEEYIKELLDIELQKMKQETCEEVELTEQVEESNEIEDNQHVITIVENEDKECEMIHIFDEEEKDEDVSGPDDEALNDSINSPPCTVRERIDPSPPRSHHSPDKISSKSSAENVTNMIESSIYCAKVKELRLKINEELGNIITYLERQDIINIDPADLPKMMKRSTEFCARFNRVHMYQLQRQMVDIERNSSISLPFAQRTHFQSQLVRVSSLHNNLFHALQVFHKSLTQTACIKESGDFLQTLMQLIRDITKVCANARPNNLNAANDLYDDQIQETSEKLEQTLNEYKTKMSDYMNSTENTSVSCSRKSSKLKGKKSIGTWSKSTKSFTNTDERLSMYSLDTLKIGLNKSRKDNSGGTSKMNASIIRSRDDAAKNQKKTPRSRRPLMRDPQAGCIKRRIHREQDVHTLVETVGCASSHISRDASPQSNPKSRMTTPRQTRNTPKTPRPNKKILTPRTRTTKKKEDDTKTTSDIRKPIDSSRSVKTSVCYEDTQDVKDKGIEDVVKSFNKEVKEMEKNSPRIKSSETGTASCEVTKLLRQLCGGDARGKNERVSGAKNAQLLCVNEGSPRKPSTPQLLRILEETIQKKAPKPLFPKMTIKPQDAEKYRMSFSVPDNVKDSLFQYRTKFVQHMLTSSMYANSAVGKPWEKIGSVSEQIIDELLLNCAKEMELHHVVKSLYQSETS